MFCLWNIYSLSVSFLVKFGLPCLIPTTLSLIAISFASICLLLSVPGDTHSVNFALKSPNTIISFLLACNWSVNFLRNVLILLWLHSGKYSKRKYFCFLFLCFLFLPTFVSYSGVSVS